MITFHLGHLCPPQSSQHQYHYAQCLPDETINSLEEFKVLSNIQAMASEISLPLQMHALDLA